MTSAVVFLQNAWSKKHAGNRWPRRSWLRALARSRSGQRLRTLAASASGVSLYFDNTTPIVGPSPSSVVPPDHEHVLAVLRAQGPDAVVACGKQAAAVLQRAWQGPLLLVPHPTYRLVTNALWARAGELLREGWIGTIELAQGRGHLREKAL